VEARFACGSVVRFSLFHEKDRESSALPEAISPSGGRGETSFASTAGAYYGMRATSAARLSG